MNNTGLNIVTRDGHWTERC